MAITFEEVTQVVINLVRRVSELELENQQLQAALKSVREPDGKKE